MAIVLRVIGAVWVLLSLKPLYHLVRSLLNQGINITFGLPEILSLTMLAGGIGLLLLKEWGRWILLVGACGFLITLVGPSLLQLRLGPVVLRHFVFYGVFIALLVIPQARAATRG